MSGDANKKLLGRLRGAIKLSQYPSYNDLRETIALIESQARRIEEQEVRLGVRKTGEAIGAALCDVALDGDEEFDAAIDADMAAMEKAANEASAAREQAAYLRGLEEALDIAEAEKEGFKSFKWIECCETIAAAIRATMPAKAENSPRTEQSTVQGYPDAREGEKRAHGASTGPEGAGE